MSYLEWVFSNCRLVMDTKSVNSPLIALTFLSSCIRKSMSFLFSLRVVSTLTVRSSKRFRDLRNSEIASEFWMC